MQTQREKLGEKDDPVTADKRHPSPWHLVDKGGNTGDSTQVLTTFDVPISNSTSFVMSIYHSSYIK